MTIRRLAVLVALGVGAANCNSSSSPSGTTTTTRPSTTTTSIQATTTAPPTGGTPTTTPTTVPGATSVTLSGTVTESGGTRGIPGAEVEILDGPGAGRKVVTDGNGAYSFSGLSAGSIGLRFRASGYDSTDRRVTIGSTNVRLDVPMPKSATTTTTTTSTATTTTTTTSVPAAQAFVKFTTTNACSCAGATISLRIDGNQVGSMACTGESTISTTAGAHTANGCGSSGACSTGQSFTLAAGETREINFFCASAARTSLSVK